MNDWFFENAAQLAWLEKDLTAVNANRGKTPWIMVMSHFPIYHSTVNAHLDYSLAHYLGDEITGEVSAITYAVLCFFSPNCTDISQSNNSVHYCTQHAVESADHFVAVPPYCRGRGSIAGPECAIVLLKTCNNVLALYTYILPLTN
jgi:hypothetical protein